MNIKKPTTLILIKKAVKNDKKIIFLSLVCFFRYKSSKIFNERKVLMSQNDKKGISLGLNCA